VNEQNTQQQQQQQLLLLLLNVLGLLLWCKHITMYRVQYFISNRQFPHNRVCNASK